MKIGLMIGCVMVTAGLPLSLSPIQSGIIGGGLYIIFGELIDAIKANR